MVNIKNENFEKLSQLDRIEYRQKESSIDNVYNTYFLFSVIVISLGAVLLNMSYLTSIYEDILNFQISGIVMIIFGVIINIFGYYYCKNKLEKLEEKYFECIVKSRGKK